VIVPFTRTQVTHAPRTEEANRLSPEQGAALHDCYGISDADRFPREARLDGAWEIVVAAEQKMTAQQPSTAWQQWLSNMRGHNEALRSATAAAKRQRRSAQTTARRTT